ncbi:MAG: S8 family serine peptidase [Candidatus Geothermincolales bacterium]
MKFKSGADLLSMAAALYQPETEALEENLRPAAPLGPYLVRLRAGEDPEPALDRIRSSPAVEYAETESLYHALYRPDDPLYPDQWHLENTGQAVDGRAGKPDADIDAPEAWDGEDGSTQAPVVAVIDTGADLGHPDLGQKIWTNPREIPSNLLDDDGNGYVDDHRGYNFAGISQLKYTGKVELGNGLNRAVAQSLRGTGFLLTHVGVALSRQGNPSQPVKVSVRTSLDGPDLGYWSVAADKIPAYPSAAWFYGRLSSSVHASDGLALYVVVSTEQMSLFDYFYVLDSPNAFADGSEYLLSGTNWAARPYYDLFFNTNENPVPRDDNGHGTHCAGIVGAATGNGTGVAGVCPGARLMVLRAGNSNGFFTTSAIARAIYYAADNGARIISMSFGGTSTSQAIADAVAYARSRGILLFAAAGNTGDRTLNYPAAYEGVIGVGATDNLDQVATFSTHNESVDLCAPGVSVLSTMPTYPCLLNSMGYSAGYSSMSGTSMACPTAAGVGALLVSARPDLSPGEWESALYRGAEDLGTPGWDEYYGHGRVNAADSLEELPKTFTVRATVTRGMGSVSPEIQQVPGGGMARIEARPAEGYYLEKIVDNGVAKGPASTYLIQPVNEDHLVEFHFARIQHTVKALANTPGGKVTPESQVVYHGERAEIRIEALEGYRLASLVDNGRPVSPTSLYVIERVTEDHEVVASFERIPETPSQGGASYRYFLAEGYTGEGFQEFVCLGNLQRQPANVEISFVAGGKVISRRYRVEGMRRMTVDVNREVGPGLEVAAFIQSDQPLVVERPVYFTYRGSITGGHCVTAVPEPSRTWFFAEGYSGPGFETYICVLNPEGKEARLTLRFQTQEEGEKSFSGPSFKVPPKSRVTFKANDLLGGKGYQFSLSIDSDQPVVVERPMYFLYQGRGGLNADGGHCVMGAVALSREYFFAEGCTRDGFEEWLCLQNPGDTAIVVAAEYQLDRGGPVRTFYQVPARSRHTVFVADAVGPERDVSVRLSSDRPFLAERPMYFRYRYAGARWDGGHCVTGSPRLSNTWRFAEGYTGPGFHVWLCLQNPGAGQATARIRYITQETGPIEDKPVVLPPKSRTTLMVNDRIGGSYQFSIEVKTDGGVLILCERASYFDFRGRDGGHDAVGSIP